MANPHQQQVHQLLQRLLELLESESRALRTLDRQALDAIASEKLTVGEELEAARRRAGSAGMPATGSESRAVLERVRRLGLQNQLLLVHARDCVRGALSLALGEHQTEAYPAHPGYGGPRPGRPMATRQAVRVNMRG